MENFDTNDDGKLSPEEIHKRNKLQNEDKREDAQRHMAWIALIGMVTYPIMILVSSAIGLIEAAEVIGEMAPVYFMSVAAIVAAFYGKEVYKKVKENNNGSA